MGVIEWFKRHFKGEQPLPVVRVERGRGDPRPVTPPRPAPKRDRGPVHPVAGFTVSFSRARAFPDLPTRRMKIVGIGNYLTFEQREDPCPRFVVLVAEPDNPVDPDAVTVGSMEGVKIGYIASGTAKAYHEVVAAAGAVKVLCSQEGSAWWIEVPRLPALRKAVGD